MKARKPTKTWRKTRKPNLLRHKSGRYYARAFARGKEVWKSLKTLGSDPHSVEAEEVFAFG
jgi:hypothetical protein